MRHFQDAFETRKQSFINALSICMAVPLKSTNFHNGNIKCHTQSISFGLLLNLSIFGTSQQS